MDFFSLKLPRLLFKVNQVTTEHQSMVQNGPKQIKKSIFGHSPPQQLASTFDVTPSYWPVLPPYSFTWASPPEKSKEKGQRQKGKFLCLNMKENKSTFLASLFFFNLGAFWPNWVLANQCLLY